MIPRSRLLRAAGVLLAAALGCGAKPPVLDIDCEPPRVQHGTFEPGHPPPVLIAAPGVEAAFCGSSFESFCRVETATAPFTAGLGTLKVKAVHVTLRLRITVWTPEGGPPEYLAHEETHRAISEHYYRNAVAIATRLATQIAHRKIDLPARKNQRMVDAAIDALAGEFVRDYQREMNDRAAFAQDRFDTITDHGREPITNPAAMAQALADEEKHWAESTAVSSPPSPSPVGAGPVTSDHPPGP